MTKRVWGTEGPWRAIFQPETPSTASLLSRASARPLDSSVILVMVRATFSRLDKLDKPRLEFELRSASCRPPQRLQRHTPHSNWRDDTEHARGRIGGSTVATFDETLPQHLCPLAAKAFSPPADRRALVLTRR